MTGQASKAELRSALDRLVPHLGYCISSQQLGLGQCRCNSHGYFWRADGEPLTPQDELDFWSAVEAADQGACDN